MVLVYNLYKDDLKKAKLKIECVERSIIDYEQNELYDLGSIARDKLKDELDKLESLQ